jgi:hypothetical protein
MISYTLTENHLTGAPDDTYRAVAQPNGSVELEGCLTA